MTQLDLRENASASASQLQQQLAGLSTLLEVTRRLAEEINLNQVLETITREACKALDCDRASLYQYDPERRELYTRVATDLEIAEIRHDIEHGISGYVARHGQLQNVPEPARDRRWNSSVDQRTGYHTRNLLAAPLRSPHDGSLLGVLELINKNTAAFNAFDEQLAQAFCQHAAVSLDRARWIEAKREHDAVELALSVARDVQRSFMPHVLPDVPGYELASWWYPHQAVGGDYCDVLRLRDGRYGLVIADVSGHGLGPALLMASVRAALRALALEHSQPAELLTLLDRALAPDLQEGRFITMLLAALDTRSHTLDYANAGHGPALVYRPAMGSVQTISATGLPLGVLDEPTYEVGPRVPMAPGDTLLLCTDGVVEAANAADQPFGRERLERVLVEMSGAPVTEVVERIAAEVTGHYVGDSPTDDLTILVARRGNVS